MQSSPSPARSGIPRLVVPSKAPASKAQRLILAVVLHLTKTRSTRHISQRELQLKLTRAGRSPIGKHLLGLRRTRFLRRLPRSKDRPKADEYVLGTALSPAQKGEWERLSRQLLGRNGICKDLLGRAAFGTRFLGHNGMLIVGLLRRSSRPLKVGEIHRALAFFIGEEGTIRNLLNKAVRLNLARKDGPFWSVDPQFDSRLSEYERDFGPLSRKTRVRLHQDRERRSFALRLSGYSLTAEQEAELHKNGRCIRCRKTNEECLATEQVGLALEHFPPRTWLEQWEIPDHPDFYWLICPSENEKYGGRITGVKAPPLDKFAQFNLVSTALAPRIVKAKLQRELQRLYRLLDNGDKKQAAAAAGRAASLWWNLVHDSRTTVFRIIPVGKRKGESGRLTTNGERNRKRVLLFPHK